MTTTRSDITVKEIHDLDEGIAIVKALSGNEFIYYEKDDASVSSFVEKVVKNGHMLSAFIKEESKGYICFYSNDLETKVGFITSIVINVNGLAKGRVLMRLATEAVRIGVRDGMTGVKIQVNKDNAHARRLYEQLGLKYTGEENENGVYMFITLDDLISRMKIRIDD